MSAETPNEDKPEQEAAPKKKAARSSKKTAASKKAPAPEAKAEAEESAAAQAEEVDAEPFDSSSEAGRTFEMPPKGAPKPGEGNRMLGATCHLLGLADLTVPVFMIGLIGPLILWLVLKDKDPEVDYHGKEAINFQINMLFWFLILFLPGICLLGAPLYALMIAEVVLVIVASVAAAKGEKYRYPFIIRVLD